MEDLLRKIDAEIAALGGKRSRSREKVFAAFFRAGRHVTVDELTAVVRRRDRAIGAATVYRALKLLTRLGYVQEVDFGEGVRRYESKLSAHHDHLVCRQCGTVSEFEEPRIEELQALVAKRHGFRAAAHRLEIYGTCRECGAADTAPGSKGE